MSLILPSQMRTIFTIFSHCDNISPAIKKNCKQKSFSFHFLNFNSRSSTLKNIATNGIKVHSNPHKISSYREVFFLSLRLGFNLKSFTANEPEIQKEYTNKISFWARKNFLSYTRHFLLHLQHVLCEYCYSHTKKKEGKKQEKGKS